MPLILDHNLRNTRQIANAFQPLVDSPMKFLGGKGPAVTFIPCTRDEAMDVGDDQIDALLDAGWRDHDIALLTTGSRHPEQTQRQQCGHKAYWDTSWDTDQVSYGHVLGFKRLERSAVVVVVNEEGTFERSANGSTSDSHARVNNWSSAVTPTSSDRSADPTSLGASTSPDRRPVSGILRRRIVIPSWDNGPMGQSANHRLHVAQSTNWKDAVITLLEPRSPYRPSRYGTTEAREGDTVAFILDTDPPSVLADVARVESADDPRAAVFNRPLRQPNVVELTTLVKVLDLEREATTAWSFEGDDAIKLELSLDECRYWCAPESRFGHNTMASARTLLRFDGRCDGCERNIDLTGASAHDDVHVHTVDAHSRVEPEPTDPDVRDWPAVLCRDCRTRMDDDGYVRFVDFKFALNPPCPACGMRRTSRTFYGMPSDFMNIEPWWHAGGCCPTPEKWCCGVCYHSW
ncbi:hypothetical protein TUM20984_56300 [Mycobacterium antarcticum]|nr:hypothetical protein TUM20984_56300 [Mycolicibacterium sp. TUM20984]